MKFYVLSSMNEDVTYNTNGNCIVIKANTATEVDNKLVSAKQLKDCYGHRISILEKWEEFDMDMKPVKEIKATEEVKVEVKEAPKPTCDKCGKEVCECQKEETTPTETKVVETTPTETKVADDIEDFLNDVDNIPTPKVEAPKTEVKKVAPTKAKTNKK